MARKLIVYNKTSRAIVAIYAYSTAAKNHAAWLANLDAENLSYVDVDNVTADSDFAGRTVAPAVVEKSVLASLTDADFPRSDQVILTVPQSAKQASTVRAEVAVKDADGLVIRPISGTVHLVVTFDADVIDEGDITLTAGEGYRDFTAPNIVTAGDHILNRILVRAIKDGNAMLSAGAWLEVTV
jgi:hypothetical protein